jgi:hypothetical protein
MKLIINNKIFIGRYNENGRLQIQLDDENDVKFFKNWEDKRKTSNSKMDYVDDIEFHKITERGFLKNCFPLLNINEDFVTLNYDLYDVVS